MPLAQNKGFRCPWKAETFSGAGGGGLKVGGGGWGGTGGLKEPLLEFCFDQARNPWKTIEVQ